MFLISFQAILKRCNEISSRRGVSVAVAPVAAFPLLQFRRGISVAEFSIETFSTAEFSTPLQHFFAAAKWSLVLDNLCFINIKYWRVLQSVNQIPPKRSIESMLPSLVTDAARIPSGVGAPEGANFSTRAEFDVCHRRKLAGRRTLTDKISGLKDVSKATEQVSSIIP